MILISSKYDNYSGYHYISLKRNNKNSFAVGKSWLKTFIKALMRLFIWRWYGNTEIKNISEKISRPDTRPRK